MDRKKLTPKWLRRGDTRKDMTERLWIINGGSTERILKGLSGYVAMPFKTKH